MPKAVSSWTTKRSLKDVDKIHNDLMTTYRDDFAKYRGRIDTQRLEEVMMAVPKHLGEKFIYRKLNPDIPTNTIKQSLDLLYKARLCLKVQGSHANGLPLAAQVQEKLRKVIFLDVGLCSTALGMSLDQFQDADMVQQSPKLGNTA